MVGVSASECQERKYIATDKIHTRLDTTTMQTQQDNRRHTPRTLGIRSIVIHSPSYNLQYNHLVASRVAANVCRPRQKRPLSWKRAG